MEIRRAWLRPLTRFLCSVAAAIGCRDEESALRLRSYGDRDDVLVAPDLAHILCSELLTGVSPENFALINIREFPPISSSVVEQICKRLLEVVDHVVLLAAEPNETAYLAEFTAGWEEPTLTRINIVKPTTLAESIRLIESARVVIAERFHVNLIAVHAVRPLVAILYEEKVANLVADLGPGHLESTIEDVSSDLAIAALELEAPAWQPLLRGWRNDSIEVFNRVVESGLDAPLPTAKQRLAGLSIVVLILGITLLRAPLILLKRALFGRGKLGARNLGRRLKRMGSGRG
jgi:polysaccharide pyruvyl transferase WcaK-like protein